MDGKAISIGHNHGSVGADIVSIGSRKALPWIEKIQARAGAFFKRRLRGLLFFTERGLFTPLRHFTPKNSESAILSRSLAA